MQQAHQSPPPPAVAEEREPRILTKLYSGSPNAQELTCAALLRMPEAALCQDLLELVYLAVARPSTALERAVVELCRRSLRVALRVAWLLLALHQDQPNNRHLALFREKAELAALDSKWALPRWDITRAALAAPSPSSAQRLGIASPPPARVPRAMPAGPGAAARLAAAKGGLAAAALAASPEAQLPWPGSAGSIGRFRASLESRLAADSFAAAARLGLQPGDARQRHAPRGGSPGERQPQRPGEGGDDEEGAEDQEQGGKLPPLEPREVFESRLRQIHAELGEGEGVTALLRASRAAEEAASGGAGGSSSGDAEADGAPWLVADEAEDTRLLSLSGLLSAQPATAEGRLRRDLFGASLDFVASLCEASRCLARFPQAERLSVLRRCLRRISAEVEAAAAQGVPVLLPIGGGGAPAERVLRLLPGEAVIFNSAEKVPFLLTLEVLGEDGTDHRDGACGPTPHAHRHHHQEQQHHHHHHHNQQQQQQQQPTTPRDGAGSHGHQHDQGGGAAPPHQLAPPPKLAALKLPPVGSPPAAAAPNGADFDGLAAGAPAGTDGAASLAPAPTPTQRQGSASLLSPTAPEGRALSALELQMQATAERLRGEGRAVRLRIRVLPEGGEGSGSRADVVEALSASWHASGGRAADGAAAAYPAAAAGSTSTSWHASSGDAGAAAAAAAAPAASRPPRQSQPGRAAGVVAPGPASPGQLPRVLEVAIDVPPSLPLGILPAQRRGRRVPSFEALDQLAGKFKVASIPPAAEVGPPLLLPERGGSGGSEGASPRGEGGGAGGQEGPRAAGSQPRDGSAQQQQQQPQQHLPKRQEQQEEEQQQEKQQQQQQEQQPADGTLPAATAEPRPPVGRSLLGWLLRRDAAAAAASAAADPPQPPPGAAARAAGDAQSAEARAQEAEAAAGIYGERWAQKARRLRRAAGPRAEQPGWAVRAVIVKSGDDCRQEALALQLIREFGVVWTEAGLPLWVRPFDVLVTSDDTALIELVPDALSIHTVKARSPPGSSLADYFLRRWGAGTPELAAAQRRFTESLAAYSLITHLLQVKDRHNGNIMLDDAGRVIHIDFGFMLTNAPGRLPGGVGFEAAPMKLTREVLEVMGSDPSGSPSELFDYFKVICIQGFLAARRERERIVTPVQVMSRSGLPCFQGGGDRAVRALQARFVPSLDEGAVVEHVLGLIGDSLDAWSTRQYDHYQRVLNGIL
ncbi:phosphatidylinositol 4-kinase beta [Raphidocelis subcapitata]|uniref:1-phosphatidylinositol 4-kinase n=1 Tax=Raphidocelis subcapitata TaxID=307507 RepID=A0A2V0P6F2_9CHLO|nr:phosphatidylinositol 4-kinase beta [Raphidocelis subcapitata]|eukprot:GBF94502.1 phosphatidylinositol 4-kinase beta [Raphidocelis subcapitata]